MGIVESLEKRRSFYKLGKNIKLSRDEIVALVKKVVHLVPDAFDCKSARVALLLGQKSEEFWDGVFDAFGGKVSHEKLDGFKGGAGTLLYFYDSDVVKGLQAKYPSYTDKFPIWAREAGGMVQIALWTALRDAQIGASIQHYNPIVDDLAHQITGFPESYVLTAQMPFGTIEGPARDKDGEDIEQRVKVCG